MENVSRGKFYSLSKNELCLYFLVKIRDLCFSKYINSNHAEKYFVLSQLKKAFCGCCDKSSQ